MPLHISKQSFITCPQCECCFLGRTYIRHFHLSAKDKKRISLKSRENPTLVTETAFGWLAKVSGIQKMPQLDTLPNLKYSWEQTLQSPGKMPGPVIMT